LWLAARDTEDVEMVSNYWPWLCSALLLLVWGLWGSLP
jgi:hypothetical protein